MKKTIAGVISKISSPLLVVGFSLFYLMLHYAQSTDTAGYWFAIAVGLIGVAPAVYIWHAFRKGYIKDIGLSRRQDRSGPFLVASIGMIVTLIVFFKIGVATEVLLFLMSGLLITLIAMVITMFWKISIHALAITAVITTVNVLNQWHFWYLLAVPLLVMWARVVLRRHTVAQVICGALLAFSAVWATFLLYGVY